MYYTEDELEKARRSMVSELKAEGFIVSDLVEYAMLNTPRHLFLPRFIRHYAYQDTPLLIARGQTISAPHMVALLCELIKPRRGMRILEVGAGTGYQACVCAKAIGEGEVYTIEIDPYLALYASLNVIHNGCKSVKVYYGDGKRGLPKHAPFDAVIVTAAAHGVPEALVEQVKVNGVIVIPIIEDFAQKLYVFEKREDGLKRRFITYVSFVELK